MSKILIIDGKKDNLESLEAVLNILNPDYEVITALSGEEGIEKVKKELPDTILLDLSLPEMDGFEVCKLLKSNDETKHIPVIMMTAGYVDSRRRIDSFKLGADAFLTKPIDEAELGAQVNVMIRIKEAEDKLKMEKRTLEELVKQRTRKLQDSEKKYRELLNLLPEVIYETDENGNLTFVNQNAFEVFGYTQKDLEKGLNVFQMIAPIDRDRAIKNFQEILSEEQLKTSEFTGLRKDGSTFPVLIYTSLVFDKNKPAGMRGIVIDISEEKKIEKVQYSLYQISEASNASDNLKQLYSSIHEIVKELIPAENLYIALYDKEKDIISFPYFVDKFDKKQPQRKFGKGITEYVLKTNKPLLVSPQEVFSMRQKGEIEFIGEVSIDWLGVPLKIEDRTIGVIAVQSYNEEVRYNKDDQDILVFVSEQIAMAINRVRTSDEIKKYSEQLRSLVARIQSIREEEKIRMTYGIREETSQVLSVLKMDLSWLEKKLSGKQKEEHEKIISMKDLIDKTGMQIMKISEELRSSQLDFLGLDAAIEWFIEEFQKRTGIKCIFDYKIGEVELSKNITVALYRIFEELIKNIEEHAKAQNISVSFVLNKGKLEMEVEDDGIGIRNDKIEEEDSLGLMDIKERVNLFNGEVNVRSTNGKGTVVIVSIPTGEVKKIVKNG